MRRLIPVAAVLLVACLLAWASTAGPNSAGTAANEAGGDIDWSNATNVTASDDSRATTALTAGAASDDLEATQFGFTVPSGTIDGIAAAIERSLTAGSGQCEDDSIKLLIAGEVAGNEKAAVGAWPGADATANYGGVADLWGLTPSVGQINATNFGISVSAKEISTTDSATCGVDHITITVTYSPGVGGRRRIITRNAGRVERVTSEGE